MWGKEWVVRGVEAQGWYLGLRVVGLEDVGLGRNSGLLEEGIGRGPKYKTI